MSVIIMSPCDTVFRGDDTRSTLEKFCAVTTDVVDSPGMRGTPDGTAWRVTVDVYRDSGGKFRAHTFTYSVQRTNEFSKNVFTEDEAVRYALNETRHTLVKTGWEIYRSY